MDKKNKIIGHLLALFTIFIWGTTFISTKIVLKVISPIEILFLRFLIGFFALIIVYPKKLKVNEKKHELYFALAGLCGVTLYFLFENIALTYTFASNVGIIVSISPFFTAIFAHYFLDGEKLKINFFIGFIAALSGIFIISFNGVNNLQLNPLGDILTIFASILWAAYSVLMKKIGNFQYNTIQTTRKIFFYGLSFMIPALFIFNFNPDIAKLIDTVNFLNIIFLGLGASAICFVTWNYAVKVLGAVKTSVYIYMVPVVTIVVSAIILDEKITLFTVLGTLLTLLGLLISESKIFIRKKIDSEDIQQ